MTVFCFVLFLHFEYVIPLPYGLHVLDEKSAVNHIEGSLALDELFLFAAFKCFSLSFNILAIMCLSIDLFVFILFGIC